MKTKLLTMLNMQNDMNKKVHPHWETQDFAWYRAIWTECAELMDHYGWKWWKKQTADVEQIKLELVDIWHFGLSILILEQGISEQTAQYIADNLNNDDQQTDFKLALEAFASNTIQSQSFDLALFSDLLKLTDMSFDQLYCAYIGKNVLNFFRQDHGYQDGSYIKVWNGLEDNEHLVEVVAAADDNAEDFREQIYQGLSARYNNLQDT